MSLWSHPGSLWSHHINEISNALDFYYFLLRIDSAEILSLLNPGYCLNQSAEVQNIQNIIVKSRHQPEKKKTAEKPRKKLKI